MGVILKQFEVQATRIPGIKLDNNEVKSSRCVADISRTLLGNKIAVREHVYAFYMNRANKIIGYAEISKGGISGTVIESRIVCKVAIDLLASGCIIVHNHPSGRMTPSSSDVRITEKIKKSLEVFDVDLLDHVVVTETNHYSFSDNSEI